MVKLGGRGMLVFSCLLNAFAFGQQSMTINERIQSIRPILAVLHKDNLSGSITFSGSCDVSAWPDFPHFRAPLHDQGSAQELLREMFSQNPSIGVTQDSRGIIRIVEENVPTNMLDVKIDEVVFGNASNGNLAFSPGVALDSILSAPEVRQFLAGNGVELLFRGGPVSLIIPQGGSPFPVTAPHVSGKLRNVRLSEAMDYVLETFPGVWVYENCPAGPKRNRVVYFQFYELSGGRGSYVVK
jgi:hypothetical protein